MTKITPKAARQADRSQAITTKASQRRGARHPTAKAVATRDDRAEALAVLVSVGVTPDDPRVRQLGAWFKSAPARNNKKTKAALDDLRAIWEIYRDYQAIERAVYRAKLATEAGKGLRAKLFPKFNLRYVLGAKRQFEEDPLKGFAVYVARCCGLDVHNGRGGLPNVSTPVKGRPGRPVAVEIDDTAQLGKSMYGWNWKACAAAVFLSGASQLKYKFIKKSFQDWHRRSKSRA